MLEPIFYIEVHYTTLVEYTQVTLWVYFQGLYLAAKNLQYKILDITLLSKEKMRWNPPQLTKYYRRSLDFNIQTKEFTLLCENVSRQAESLAD